MVREIPLTQGKVALVSDADYERVMQFRWCACLNQKHWYAKRSIRQDGKTHTCYLHRFILGVPDAIRIDHHNGDGLDCQRHNLRYATPLQNWWNSKVNGKSRTGFKGVSPSGKYFATAIVDSGQRINLGRYATAEEAARVYDAAARRFQGDFAWTNFAEPDAAAGEIVKRVLAGEPPPGVPRFIRKLTDDDVRDARCRYAAGGVMIKELAAEHDVSFGTMCHAISGRTFGHITDPPPLKMDKRVVQFNRREPRPRGPKPIDPAHTTGSFGDWLRQQRVGSGWTQATFAAAIGATQSHVSHIERGHYPPSPPILDRIYAALGVRWEAAA